MSTNFTLLTVCTGNVCRSPAAERLLAHRLGSSVRVHSAGTHALVGEPIHGPMAPLVDSRGGSSEGFAARQISEDLIRQSQLVLTMTREHRARTVDLWPGAVRRTFTLREFARIVSGLGEAPAGDTAADRLAKLVPLATAARATYPAQSAADDDIVDPYRRADTVYLESMDQIESAVNAIADVVG